MPSIKGHSVLVIGGSSGIGAGVAKLAAEEGLRVFIASSNPSRVEKAIEKIKADVPNANITGYTADVGGDNAESNLEKLFTDVVAANHGTPLDHIVYTAFSLEPKPLNEITIDQIRHAKFAQFLMNVPFLIAKLAPRFVQNHYKSSLTFTTGILGERPMKGTALGSAFASSLIGTTKALAIDLVPIRVNVVSPGFVDTEILGPMEPEQHAKLLADMAKLTLLGKVATPEEVAEAYIYCMKDTNNTGSTINTNGGALLQYSSQAIQL